MCNDIEKLKYIATSTTNMKYLFCQMAQYVNVQLKETI